MEGMFDAARTVSDDTPELIDLSRYELRRIGRPGNSRQIYVIPDYQIKLRPGEPWHRRGGIQSETACGEQLAAVAGYHSRAFTLDADLCDQCFTKHERELGRQAVARAKTKSADPDGGALVARPRTLTPRSSSKLPKP